MHCTRQGRRPGEEMSSHIFSSRNYFGPESSDDRPIRRQKGPFDEIVNLLKSKNKMNDPAV